MDKIHFNKEYLENGVVCLEIAGKIDAVSTGQFNWIIWGLFAEKSYRIILDLSKLESMDSTGVGVLVNASDTARENGGKLVILNPSAKVKWAMDTLCLTSLFTFADSREAAATMLT